MRPQPGLGVVEVVRAGAGSVVTCAYAASPLRLLTPRNAGHAAWIYAASYGGGLVGGDALRLDVRVGGQATAFLSTQASTKIYRSDRAASFELTGSVAAGGQLVIWPDPVVCFAGSAYDQRQHIDLEAHTALVLVDWMTSGRRASGERWRFDRYSNRLTVRYDGHLVLLDPVALSADAGNLVRRMGRFDVLCTATIVGPVLADAVDRILGRVAVMPAARRADLLIGAAPLSGTGCIMRMAGTSVEDVGRLLREHLSFVPTLLGDDPSARKW